MYTIGFSPWPIYLAFKSDEDWMVVWIGFLFIMVGFGWSKDNETYK